MTNINRTFVSHIILILCITIFIILRIPSLFEPHWYGDEGVYAGVAYAMEHGRTLYTEVWDNKPPGIYFLYMLGNPENRLLVIRLLNILAGALTIAGLLSLMKRLQFNTIASTLSLGLATFLLGTPLFEGNIANGENFFLPFIVWGLYFGLSHKSRDLFIAGCIFGLGFWIKFHPFFDLCALALYSAIISYKKSYTQAFRSVATLFLGFLLPIIALFGYLIYHDTLIIGLKTIFLGNVSYTRVFQLPYLTQEVRIGLLITALTTACWLFSRRKISRNALFILCVFCIEYFAALLSGRRYTHYLLGVIPGLSLLVGFTLSKLWEYKHLARSAFLTSVISISLILGFYIFSLGDGYLLDTDPISYYSKFFSYIRGEKSYFLNPIEERIQKLNSRLRTKYVGAKIHLYTDNPWYYDQTQTVPPLSFIPAYHQALRENGQQLYIQELEALQPTLIVVEKSSYRAVLFTTYLDTHFVNDGEDETFIYYIKRDARLSVRR